MATQDPRDKPRRDRPLNERDVIATRSYEIEGGSAHTTVTLKLGRPRLMRTGGRYECGAEVREGGRVWVRYLIGADSFEALQLALIMLGTDLKHLDRQLGGRLARSEQGDSELAFPVPPDFSLRCSLDVGPDEPKQVERPGGRAQKKRPSGSKMSR